MTIGGHWENWRATIDAARNAEVRRMLGEWVSECEPQLVMGPKGVAGLAVAGERHYDGPEVIIVHARTVEIALTAGGEVIGTHAVAMPLLEVRRRHAEDRGAPLYLRG